MGGAWPGAWHIVTVTKYTPDRGLPANNGEEREPQAGGPLAAYTHSDNRKAESEGTGWRDFFSTTEQGNRRPVAC